jgi:hypothetical protein
MTDPIQPSSIFSPLDDHPPAIVFIVPYRDREPHKHFFSEYMNGTVMADYVKNRDYAIYFVEQKDARPFNRGAMKNIGFLALKYKYPLHYKDITFVFNDVDTVPYKNILDYITTHGVIKHFYGFTFALGGIFSITGADFERIGGFPNFWGWGCEDNSIYDRALQNGIYVDRGTFFKIGDMNILHIYDGVMRNICRTEAYSSKMNSVTETMFTIKNLKFEYIDALNDAGDCGVDVLYFETQTDASTVRIEAQNILTDKKIDIRPVIKERFGIDTTPPPKPSLHQYQPQQQAQHVFYQNNRKIQSPMRPIQMVAIHHSTAAPRPVPQPPHLMGGASRNIHIPMMRRPFIKQ